MKITKALTRLTGPETAPVFVLLHGWGSNEYDLPDLLNYCGAGSADYASLQAPIAYGMGYTWFGAWAHEGVPEGESLDKQATEAAQAIDAWLRSIFPPLGRWLPWDSRRAASWPRIFCDAIRNGMRQRSPAPAGWLRGRSLETPSWLR